MLLSSGCSAGRIAVRPQSGSQREARLEASLLQPSSPVSYRIGAAAKEFRPFEGKEDGANYILEFAAYWVRTRSLWHIGHAN